MVNASFCIPETVSLRAALARLNQNEKKILFLTDEAGHLTAALTDGDVRRYMLAGGTLEDSAANAGNRPPIAARSREEALRLLARHGCVAVPVLDGDACITDIVLEAGWTSTHIKKHARPWSSWRAARARALSRTPKFCPSP